MINAGEVVIYALCDPVTGERRYIGKSNDLALRVRCHRWEARSSNLHTHKVNWLRSLPCDPKVEVLEVCDGNTWQEAERRWIAVARANGERLTNFADGGQTSPVEGKGHTDEARAKMRAAAIRNGTRPPSRKGQPVSPAVREKYRAAALKNGNTPPPMGGWNKGLKRTHCPQGHAYTASNVRIVIRHDRNRTYQSCRTCERRVQINFRLRRAA